MKLASKLLMLVLALALVVCALPAAFAATGDSPDEPAAANLDNFSGYYVIDHVAESTATYWYTFTPEYDGFLELHVQVDAAGDYSWAWTGCTIEIMNYTTGFSVVMDSGDGCMAFQANAGDAVVVGLTGPVGAYFCVKGFQWYRMGNEDDAVTMAGTAFTAVAMKNTTVYYTNVSPRMGGTDWTGKGVTISTTNNKLANVSVIVGSETYTDTNGNGKIEFTLDGTNVFAIKYGAVNQPGLCEVTILDAPQTECDHDAATKLTDVAAEAAGCHTDGIKAHKVCECGKLFATDGTTAITEADTIDPADNALVFNQGTPATCDVSGIADYWHCPACGKNYEDNYGEPTETEITDLLTQILDPLNHSSAFYYEAAAATCGNEGSTGYSFCWSCEKYFRDETCTQEITEAEAKIPCDPENHEWRLLYDWEEGYVAPSCTGSADLVYKCGNWNHSEPVTKTVPTGAHQFNLEHFEEDPATLEAPGTEEHWYCPDCEKYFADANATQEVTKASLEIPKLLPPPPANTGDSTVVVVAMMGVVALASLVVLGKKKYNF